MGYILLTFTRFFFVCVTTPVLCAKFVFLFVLSFVVCHFFFSGFVFVCLMMNWHFIIFQKTEPGCSVLFKDNQKAILTQDAKALVRIEHTFHSHGKCGFFNFAVRKKKKGRGRGGKSKKGSKSNREEEKKKWVGWEEDNSSLFSTFFLSLPLLSDFPPPPFLVLTQCG